MESSRAPLLWQAFAKLEYADFEFRSAVSVLDQFIENGGVGTRERFNGADGSFSANLFAELIPAQIPLFIAGGIHGLRSALDTAVSVLIENAGGTQDARINFPVHATERELTASFEAGTRVCPDCKTERSVKAHNHTIRHKLPDLERLILDEFRPWKGGNYQLWALSKLDNLCKHRMILPIFSVSSASVDFRTVEGMKFQNNLWEIEAGQEITLARSKHQIAIAQENFNTVLTLPKGIPLGGEPVFEVLSKLFKLTQGIVVTLQSHFEGGEAPATAT